MDIPQNQAQLLLIGAISDFISNHSVTKTASNLSQDCITNVITKDIDELVLGIRGHVCSIPRCSLEMVLQVGVTGCNSEVEQNPEVAVV